MDWRRMSTIILILTLVLNVVLVTCGQSGKSFNSFFFSCQHVALQRTQWRALAVDQFLHIFGAVSIYYFIFILKKRSNVNKIERTIVP